MTEIDRMQIERETESDFAGTATTFWCGHSAAIGEEFAI